MGLREAREEDLEEIIEIYWENYEELFGAPRDALKKLDERIWGRNYPFLSVKNLKEGLGKRYEIVVYEKDGKILGFALFYENDEIFLDEIHVRKGYRRKGIGKEILKHIIDRRKRIVAYASEKSLEFFKKAGFEVKGSFVGYLGMRWYRVEYKGKVL